MINEDNLLEYIKNSKFIDSSIKNNLIKYYDKLNTQQIKWLIDYFNNHKRNILKILVDLKDKDICSFEEIKFTIDNLSRKNLKNNELIEYENDQAEILNLINSIE